MQYQLQYDNEGTASLKEIDAIPTRKVSEGTFNVSEYFAPRIDYGITETYADTFSPEKQLELIQKKLLGQNGDHADKKDGPDYKKNLSPDFDWKTYTYNEYVKALGEDAANDWLNYGKIGDIAKLGNWASIVFPVDYLTKGILKGTGRHTTKKREDITRQYLNSDYYTNKMNAMDQDYKDYGDYDVYSDISYGPTYGKDYKPGTRYDAEDYGDPTIMDAPDIDKGIMSKPKPISVPVPAHISGGGNGSQRSDRQHTGHGTSGMGRDLEDRM